MSTSPPTNHYGSRERPAEPFFSGFADLKEYGQYFDRRALERKGWLIQSPDGYRGAPFQRAIHPDWVELVKRSPSLYPRDPGKNRIVQTVYVPIGAEDKTWVSRSWLYIERVTGAPTVSWYQNDSDFRVMLAWDRSVLFIKSDH